MASREYEDLVTFLHSELNRHQRLALAYCRGTTKASRAEQVMGEAFHRVEAKHLRRSLKALGFPLPDEDDASAAKPQRSEARGAVAP